VELTAPVMTIVSLLIVLYWHELIHNASLDRTPYITKLAVPFYVLSSVLMAIEVIRIVLGTLAIAIFEVALFASKLL